MLGEEHGLDGANPFKGTKKNYRPTRTYHHHIGGADQNYHRRSYERRPTTQHHVVFLYVFVASTDHTNTVHDTCRIHVAYKMMMCANTAGWVSRPPKSCRTFIMSSVKCSGVAYRRVVENVENVENVVGISWDNILGYPKYPKEVGPKPSCDQLMQ